MKRSLILCTVIALALMVPHLSSAALIDGIATNGASTRVGDWYDGTNYKWVKYYIPLRSDTSGTYGVDAGTTPDSVRAQNLGGSLSMYIEFAPAFDNPALTASVDFWFKDLDLTPDNDPVRFMETVQFSVWNGIDYQRVTRIISDENDDQWNSRFSITGDNDLRKISFHDVTDWLPSPGSSFKWLLDFTTDYNTRGLDCYNPCLTNTREKLAAKLTTAPVPEPATMLLVGSGLLGLAGFGRKRFKKS